jgi:hypothetical protein
MFQGTTVLLQKKNIHKIAMALEANVVTLRNARSTKLLTENCFVSNELRGANFSCADVGYSSIKKISIISNMKVCDHYHRNQLLDRIQNSPTPIHTLLQSL